VSSSAGSGSPDAAADEATSAIGWWRAALSATVILVVGLVLLVYLPNWVLENVDRHGRVTVTTIVFFAVLIALAWGVRRLQAHHEI
jgi:Kef-type K+ transport system membrane component KefB